MENRAAQTLTRVLPRNYFCPSLRTLQFSEQKMDAFDPAPPWHPALFKRVFKGFILCVCFVCMCVHAPWEGLVSVEVRRGCWISWQIKSQMVVSYHVGTKSGSSTRETSALNHCMCLRPLPKSCLTRLIRLRQLLRDGPKRLSQMRNTFLSPWPPEG